MKNLIRLFLLGAVVSASTVSLAQDRELNWAEKMFSELRHDFGTVARGADVRHYIVVTNIYQEDIEIVDVDTTCGCTAAKPDKTLLKTHEKANIEVKMNTTKFMRQKDSNVDVTLRFNGQYTKSVRVPISAYIRSDVVVTPGNADFGSIELGQGGVQNIEIAYAGREDWKIRDVRIGNDHIVAQLKETTRGAGQVKYQLAVQVGKDAPLGNITDQITLITDDANSPEVPIRVIAKVEPDIVVTPASFPLGKLSPGQQKTFNVVLRGKRPFAIQGVECDANPDCFEVMQLSQDAKTVHVVPFRVTAPAKMGEFEENFTVSIAGRKVPLTFDAKGVIAEGS